MDCRTFVETVTDYWEDAMNPSMGTEFEAHLAECEGCGNYLRELDAAVALLNRANGADPIDGALRERILSTFREHDARRG